MDTTACEPRTLALRAAQKLEISNLVLFNHEAEDQDQDLVTRYYNLDPKILGTQQRRLTPLSFAPIATLADMHLVMHFSNVPGTGEAKQG